MRWFALMNLSKTSGITRHPRCAVSWSLLVLTLCTSLATTSVARGQAPPKKATSEDKSLFAKDGAEIKVTYFKSNVGQDAAVVVMLHGKGGSRLIWKAYAEALQKADFAVITVDLRGYGESTGGPGGTGGGKKSDTSAPKAKDYVNMVGLDMEAVKKFLFDEHQKKQLNMNKMGIVATDMSTPVAIAYTEFDWEKKPYDDAPTLAQGTPRGQDVQALVLLSPEATAPGLNVSKSLAVIRVLARPVLLGVGSKNKSDLTAANKMYDLLAPKKEEQAHIEIQRYDTPLEGTNLLGKNFGVEKQMFDFLNKHLKDYKSEWRDRRNKLDQ
ncbi:MAG: alpha/beta fold hydrolase [Candidatus Saccharimonas sp.]|nr:alpha/beta fold hydrolase [Planctomycetaceae bacterium]